MDNHRILRPFKLNNTLPIFLFLHLEEIYAQTKWLTQGYEAKMEKKQISNPMLILYTSMRHLG